jgi:RNA polymerase sigma factor (sigma-70 family)
MAEGRVNRLLSDLRRAARAPGDGELLTRFIERRDEAAFAALLRRHGPMVLGVCRRILGDAHDADDAFQAAFLVLVRRAASVRPREAVGGWLHGVACRTALEARRRRDRRRAREKPMPDAPQVESRPDEFWWEMRPLLDRELSRLPSKYRLPVVLCDLEGRGRKEVARQLAIPEGTLSSRLATARKRLAARLARLGFALSGASLAALLAESAAPACVPVPLSLATVKAAMLVAAGQAAAAVVPVSVAALTEGVLKTMFLAKLKTMTVVLFGAVALGLGTGGLLYQTRAGAADMTQAGRKPTAEEEKARRPAEDARERERALLEKLEQARREAEAQRDRAEAERLRAEEALRALKEQLAKAQEAERRARHQAEQALYAENVRQAQQQAGAKPEEAVRLKRLDEMEARLRERFKEERKTLTERLKHLEAEERDALAKLEAERGELLRQQNRGPNRPAGGQQPQDGDKLDRILERLERMERRLEALEKGGRK